MAFEVNRHSLQHRLRLEVLPPLTVVRAPAGYGKTTMLGQVARRWRDDGARVLSPTGDSIVSGAAFAELNEAAHAGLPVVLILDRLHDLAPEDWDSPVATALAGLHPRQHIVLVVRQGVPRAVQSAGQAMNNVVIGSDVLRFSATECRRLLASGHAPAKAGSWCETVQRMTGGWPAAIASLAHASEATADALFRTTPRPTGPMASESSRFGLPQDSLGKGVVPGHRWEGYVCEQILNAQPLRARTFLLTSALLGEAHPDLCDMVLGHNQSRDIIDVLVEGELLKPIAADGGWFAHHPLLADTLRRLQYRNQPLWSQAVHQRAAHWHLGRGDRRRALAQLLALGDYTAAAALADNDRPASLGRVGITSAARGAEAAEPVGAATLTAREAQVLELIGRGLANKDISRALYVSLSTVKAHVYNIFRKLGVASRTAAVAQARKNL